MKIAISFDTENAAFADDMEGEVGRIMEQVYAKVMTHATSPSGQTHQYKLRDSNGNSVGTMEVSDFLILRKPADE